MMEKSSPALVPSNCKPAQVDCPRPRCLGLGYLGFETVMCFLCEHQWDASSGVVEGTETPLEEGEDAKEAAMAGVKVKRCPSCHEYLGSSRLACC